MGMHVHHIAPLILVSCPGLPDPIVEGNTGLGPNASPTCCCKKITKTGEKWSVFNKKKHYLCVAFKHYFYFSYQRAKILFGLF